MLFTFAKPAYPFLQRTMSTCTPEARSLVISILAGYPEGLRSQDVYTEALKKNIVIEPLPVPKGVPGPPNPEHPIRSMKYLKRVVLEDLLARKLVVKTHTPLDEPIPVYVNKKGKPRKQLQCGEWRWKLVETVA